MNLLDNFWKYFIINSMGLNSHHIVDLSELNKLDLDLIGKKAYLLSELKYLGIPIPDGFVITTSFFKEFLQETGIDSEIKEIQSLSHPAIVESIAKLFLPIQKKIIHTPIPQNLAAEIYKFYRKLSGVFKETSLNIFSSSLNNKSTQTLDIKGDANLMLKIKTIWASQLEKSVAIVVQKNIKSKIKGKIFTNDPLINDQNLTKLAKKIQNIFYFPQEVSYVIEKNKIYITQVKPFTGAIDERQKRIQPVKKMRKILIRGVSVNPGIVTGPVKLINNQNFDIAKNSEIIVTKSLNKSLYNKIKKAKAVVADTVLQTSIDKFHYRKIIKTPTIIGCENATKLLQNGNIITVNGVTGEIYSGGFI